MKRRALYATALALTCAPVLLPVSPAVAVATKAIIWSIETTKIGQLLDNPAAKAIFVRHLPYVANSSQIWIARGMTLRQIQKHSKGYITDEKLAAMDADLKSLPAAQAK
jgi:para-nitrobenzyl esterase